MRASTHNDGYYEYSGDDVPAWAIGMAPCEVIAKPAPDSKAIKAAEIRALEAPLADEAARMTRQVTLQTALDWACKQAPNLTTEQVHAALMAQGTGYFKLYNLEQAVKAIRDRP